MEDTRQALLGVQLTLVGIFLSTLFGGMTGYVVTGVALVLLGTAVVIAAVFQSVGP